MCISFMGLIRVVHAIYGNIHDNSRPGNFAHTGFINCYMKKEA
jgi:hypothetical protein